MNHLPAGETISKNWGAQHGHRPRTCCQAFFPAADVSVVADSIVATILSVLTLSAFLQPIVAQCFSKSPMSKYCFLSPLHLFTPEMLQSTTVLSRTRSSMNTHVRHCEVFCQVPVVKPRLLQKSCRLEFEQN